MFLNRLFFRRDTGQLITRNYINDYGTRSVVTLPTVDFDFASFSALKPFNKEAVAVVEIAENEHQKNVDSFTATTLTYNSTTNDIVFDFAEAPRPISEQEQIDLLKQRDAKMQEDISLILEALGG